MLVFIAWREGIKPSSKAPVASCADPDRCSTARRVLVAFNVQLDIIPTVSEQSAEAAIVASSRQKRPAVIPASSAIEGDTRLQTNRRVSLVLRVGMGRASMPAHASVVLVAGINPLKLSIHASIVWWVVTRTWRIVFHLAIRAPLALT